MEHRDLITIFAVLATSFVSPMVLSFFTNRARRADKRLDWEREDETAKRAEKVAKDLQESNRRVAAAALVTNEKLDVIHTLVNSNVTKEMEARLEGSRRELAGLKEIIELRRSSGHEPTEESLAVIIATQDGIHELENDLADRRRQQKVVERQQQQHHQE